MVLSEMTQCKNEEMTTFSIVRCLYETSKDKHLPIDGHE